ncbi:hypothetical protein AAG570_009554 [Ranatra chinensis]|uniref:K Homology domain-containing protein n=1 Tax=Ranatra chinensis TaxID=642074 RepID=A0ABD0ZAJ4_9HEMI
MEEGQIVHSEQLYIYDEVFPALPESNPTPINDLGKWSNKMRIGSSVITQVFRVPHDERRFDNNDSFGEGESMRTCSGIMKDTGAHIEISTSKDMSLTFLVTGKHDNVLEARRKILSTFQTQANSTVSIPKEHHRWILGKAGAKLKELEKNTATKITVPSINDSSDKIVVVGTREAIEKAIHEMHLISDAQSKKAFEHIIIPKVYHPFIHGAHNEKVIELMNRTGTRIHIPPPSVQSDDITIAGEKEGVAIAKNELQSMYELMEKTFTTVCVEVSKMQHKYVIGPKGSYINEILQTCGVSVEVPPLDSPKETITLRGPHKLLGIALTKVYEKASSVEAVNVDAPSWIHKYIIGRKGANIKQITQDLSKVHVQFTEKEDKIAIEGPPDEVEQAQTKLKELVAEMVNKLTFTTLTVDAKYFKHIIGKNGANINRIKDQTGVVINIADTEQNEIRIEGDKDGVQAAKQELEDMVAKMEMEKEKDVIIDWKFHKALIGQKGEAIRDIREKFNQVQINFPAADQKSDVVKLRGPKDEVDKCHKYLIKKLKELVENSYSIEVPAFKQCHKFIIGRGGANIKKLREETNTNIDMPSEGQKSDVIIITGKKENVEKARDKIIKIQTEQMNIVTDEVTISPKIYNSLIGVGGKLIRSIMDDCGGVTIKFPPPESKSDKVMIRGPKEDVEKAKQQLLEQASERELHSFSAEVRAKTQNHKYLIGKSGVNIKRIRESTGTRIIFPTDRDEDKEVITIIGKKEAVLQAKAELEAAIEKIDSVIESDMIVEQKHHKHFVARRCVVLHQLEEEFGGVTISFPRNGVTSNKVTIKGPPQFIDSVKQRITDIIKDLEERVTIVCEVPQKHHRALMGSRGSKVQDIEAKYDVKIKFPDRNLQAGDTYHEEGEEDDLIINGETGPRPCDQIKITGKPKNCEEAKQALKDNEPVTQEMHVPFDYHGGIIGNKGQTIREMMDDYDVYIEVPSSDLQNDYIKITGAPTHIEKAKEGIHELMKRLDEEKQDRILKSFKTVITVDPEYHPKIIGKGGSVVKKIREEHGVQINLPKRGDPDESIITIIGYEDKTIAARDAIMAIVTQLNERTREDVEIDSRVHSRLIGARGRSIRKIMEDFKVEIKFPKSTDLNPNLVTITGNEDNVFEAKDHLLNLEEEYLQDIAEQELRDSYRVGGGKRGCDEGPVGREDSRGFVVAGGPWEQRAPDTASTHEFPTFGAASTAPPPATPWGPRR